MTVSSPSIENHVENAHPVDALLARASAAQLLVVGASEHPLAGIRPRASVGETCALLSRCPVVVVEIDGG